MSPSSGVHGRFARILDKLSSKKEMQYLIDDTEDEIRVVRESSEYPFPDWQSPKQLPISIETVFLSRFRNDPKRFSHNTGGSMTIDEAWNVLSPSRRRRYKRIAKKNEIRNTRRLAEFNKRCPLSASTEDFSSFLPYMHAVAGLNVTYRHMKRPWLFTLQRWKSYRSDYPSGSHKTHVPEKPCRIMDLPFELRREIYSLVLSRPYPLLQFPSDGSADALHGTVDVRLFAVSKQIFAEAVRTFYEVNTLSISTIPSSYLKALPLFVRRSTGDEAPRPTNCIRRVHVSFHFATGASTDTDVFRFLWKRFCEFLKTCRKLRTVEVSARWLPLREFDGAINLQIDRLVEILKSTIGTVGATSLDVMKYKPFEYQGAVVLHNRCRLRRIVCTVA